MKEITSISATHNCGNTECKWYGQKLTWSHGAGKKLLKLLKIEGYINIKINYENSIS